MSETKTQQPSASASSKTAERDTPPYNWKNMPRGGIIPEGGNAADYETGSWRTYRPIWDPEKCIHCMTCWILCPDSAIIAKEGKIQGVDYMHCKGCGICAQECPDKVRAISMILESDAQGEDDEDASDQ